MKRVIQITSSHCGPAVLEMLLSYLGYDIDQNSLVEGAGVSYRIKDYGMTIDQLDKAINSTAPDLNFWYKKNSTLTELKQIISIHKFPVGVEWQGVFEEDEDEDNGHYCAVTYVDHAHGTIHLSDPYIKYAGNDRIFGMHLFEKRWWDVNEVRNPETGLIQHIADDRTMFVITPSHIHFASDLGMQKG